MFLLVQPSAARQLKKLRHARSPVTREPFFSCDLHTRKVRRERRNALRNAWPQSAEQVLLPYHSIVERHVSRAQTSERLPARDGEHLLKAFPTTDLCYDRSVGLPPVQIPTSARKCRSTPAHWKITVVQHDRVCTLICPVCGLCCLLCQLAAPENLPVHDA